MTQNWGKGGCFGKGLRKTRLFEILENSDTRFFQKFLKIYWAPNGRLVRHEAAKTTLKRVFTISCE